MLAEVRWLAATNGNDNLLSNRGPMAYAGFLQDSVVKLLRCAGQLCENLQKIST